MSESRIVWSDEGGDLRKKKTTEDENIVVDESQLTLSVRRLTSGKGRTIIEVSGLPNQKKWCQKLAKELKKSIGVGGAYKNDYIEVHGEKLDQVLSFLNSKSLRYKKIGG
ncbi:MAG: hypothetical protein KAG61_08555 [Bacteriovoracaceae bacterium]|nr:hypothetical protein [Bacteriovoracaceae bacterium]